MKSLLWALTLVALPAAAVDTPSGCARLCGSWALDSARSETPAAPVDAALEKYQEPQPRKPHRPHMEDPLAPLEEPPLEKPERPHKDRLRTELLESLAAPAAMVFGEHDDEILIQVAGATERRLFPGEPHSRIDSTGTTRIDTEWKKEALVVKESHGRKDKRTETYALLPDGALQVTLVVERPGLATLHLRVVYRRS